MKKKEYLGNSFDAFIFLTKKFKKQIKEIGCSTVNNDYIALLEKPEESVNRKTIKLN